MCAPSVCHNWKGLLAIQFPIPALVSPFIFVVLAPPDFPHMSRRCGSVSSIFILLHYSVCN